jgi:hypothetical protein
MNDMTINDIWLAIAVIAALVAIFGAVTGSVYSRRHK